MGVKPLKTVQQAMALLGHFDAEHPKRSLAELHRITLQPKTNIYRMLFTLESLGYVEKEPETSRYYLSLRMFELGSRALRNLDLRELGHRYLKELYERTRETVMLSALDKTEIVHLDVIHSQDLLRAVSHVGARWPAHATASGLAMLAFSHEDVIQAVVARGLQSVTEYTITDPDTLRRELDLIRERGFSTNRGGRRAEILGIGAPVLGRSGYAEAGMAVSVPLAHADDGRHTRLEDAVREVSAQFSRSYGYAPAR